MLPVLQRLIRQVLDQIKAPGAQRPRPQGLVHPGAGLHQVDAAMSPAKVGQNRIIEALAAQADPIDPSRQNRLQAGMVKAGGIHFQGDFRTWLQAELLRRACSRPWIWTGLSSEGVPPPMYTVESGGPAGAQAISRCRSWR